MPDAYREQPIQHWRTSVVIVGSGVAGLACALALAPTPVLLLTKTAVPEGGSSPYAQGGLAAAIGDGDSPENHAADTVDAGAGMVDPERALLLAREGAEAVRALIDAGVPFDRAHDGTITLGREAAHSFARIVHAGGDFTGRNLVSALLRMVAATPSVRVISECFVVDLVKHDGRATGLLAYQANDGWVHVHANHVVLATGGIGSLWRETTNPAEGTGDGLALAVRAGARLADLEFVQFHPTALLPARHGDGSRLPLLTEALRGAGALLLDVSGRRFMLDEHPLAELAPRDIVARAIARRTAAGERVLLDLRPALAAKGEASFPQALTLCGQSGYDPRREPVPVAPAAHYHMGGVVTDACGRTNVDGLWACGEVAMTGVHGANRLASNSLLEGLVFGQRVAEDIRRAGPTTSPVSDGYRIVPAARVLPVGRGGGDPKAATRAYGDACRYRPIRRGPAARRPRRARRYGRGSVSSRRSRLPMRRRTSRPSGAVASSAICSTWRGWSYSAALRRTESRGAHFRADCPEPRAEWRRRLVLTMTDIEALSLPAERPRVTA